MKHKLLILFALVALFLPTVANAQKTKKVDLKDCTKVEIQTTMGNIEIALYNETPQHRDNFIKLVKEGTYDGVLFHRVIKDFMIQGGDVKSKTAKPGEMLGDGDLNYTVPAEFVFPKYFHKKGALAAARTGDQVNPERASSACQFYIVTGKVYTPSTLATLESRNREKQKMEIFQRLATPHRKDIMKMRMAGDTAGMKTLQDELIKQTEAEVAKTGKFTFTPEQIEAYTTVGGAPHLDGSYTVYGEVTKGLDVVDKIQNVDTDGNDRPTSDVKVIKMTIKK